MRHFAIVAVGIVALVQSAGAQNRFEQQVRTQLDRVGQNLAKKGFELTTQPSPAVFREVGDAETVEEELRLVAEGLRIDGLLGLDGPLHLRGADVRVDEPVQMPAHAQAEPHVSLRDPLGDHPR